MTDDEEPKCNNGSCRAFDGERGCTSCMYCGGELIELNGCWYHHSQFDEPELGPPQDYITREMVTEPTEAEEVVELQLDILQSQTYTLY